MKRIIRHKEVRDKVGVSMSMLFNMVAKGQFPRPFAIIPKGRAVGWVEEDVDAWIEARRDANEAGEKTPKRRAK